MARLVQFRTHVWEHYCAHARDLPWRTPKLKERKDGSLNPYTILVSEVMLQQTQVDRVIPYYQRFIKRFPSVQALARASQREVFELWQGLGYNRRARMLHQAAQVVQKDYKGRMPKTYEALVTLPGIGSYTAGAICAFAYNKPVAFIETNIRTVFLHHFFKNEKSVSDKDIIKLVEQALDITRVREWYWALMDYGAYLKQTEKIKNNARSRHYKKQKPFKGSDREVRGAVVRELLATQRSSVSRLYNTLSKKLPVSEEKFSKIISTLDKEGIINKQGARLVIR